MSKLDDVMMNKTLSNVSKMIYSYMCVATGEEKVILTRDGFKRMYEAVVSGSEGCADECFDEFLSSGLTHHVSTQEDGVTVYELIR